MTRLVIIGAGVFGQQVMELAEIQGTYDTIGFYDDFNTDSEFQGVPILGKIDQVQDDFDNGKFDYLFIGIGYNHLRFKQKLIHQFSEIPMPNIMHPSVIVEKSSTLGKGILMYAQAYVGPNNVLKDGVTININSYLAHESTIGECTFFSGGIDLGGKTNVGECSFIGLGATVSDDLTIGDEVFLGAGTLVVKDILESGTYIGSPARKLK